MRPITWAWAHRSPPPASRPPSRSPPRGELPHLRGTRTPPPNPTLTLTLVLTLALALTRDVGLLQEVGQRIGAEAAARGVSVVLGPGVNIKRSPLCGRNFEYFSG
eukprot:scaffold39912_cov62-Phaeocystis_antarctica.AAC.9